MSKPEPTRVKCLVCGHVWQTRARKKAICTGKDSDGTHCKSTKVIVIATGIPYSKTDPFILKQRKESHAKAKKMKIRLDEEPITELIEDPLDTRQTTQSKKEVLDLLFEDDGLTPKIDASELSSLFKGLPTPSPELTVIIQNLSVLPARTLGPHWFMAPEQAQFICSAALQLLADQGYKVGKIKSEYIFIAAIGAWLIPNLIITIMDYFVRPKEPTPTPAPIPQAQKIDLVDKHAQHVKEIIDQPRETDLGGALDDDGQDRYADRRTITKPSTG